ncbi:dTDP-4-dehydrorhamnose reductase [Corynebacterium sp.]|uniref:dTDP-4-dehydrorhamnose reductase n=1 Tax=Corynebacterium sp. TaxID=1720 RepID=UPI0025B97992|nr:dTDP-4-dehydrorhamnose reductase [Corynebacterium sp.]
MTRAVVVGAGGQLGTALRRRMPGAGVDVTWLTREDLDVADAGAVAAHPALRGADVVINAAAWTDVDGAETPEGEAGAERINAVAPGLLARRCAEEGAFFVHVSTDYVFGEGAGQGERGAAAARRPLRADDPTSPDTTYGRTKLAGERAVLDAVAEARLRAAIVRTAWVFSGPTQPEAPDFVSTMLRLEERGRVGEGPESINVVDDQHGSPTFVDDLADALWQLALRPVGGVFHVTGTGAATWHDVASEVFAMASELRGGDAAESKAARARVRPCTSEEFPRPAKRPAWSVLDGGAWVDAGFAPLPEWRDGLRRSLGAKSE